MSKYVYRIYISFVVVKSIESVISSIDESLRSLNNKIYSMTYVTPRWELSIETQNRKLETLETKISRIETLLDLRIEKLTESLSSKSLKEEISKEQLNRKIDTLYDRLRYMESKIENSIGKLQANLDAAVTKITSQLEHFEKTTNDIENDVLEISTSLEDTKTMIMNLNASTTTQDVEDARGYFNIQQYYDKLEKNLASEIDTQNEKLSTMYKDLNHITKHSEEMTRKSLDLVNATRRELQDGVKSIKSSIRHICPTMQDGTIDYLIAMDRKIESTGRKLDNNIERLQISQDLFLKNCHRIQTEEPQMESKISEILEKIMHAFDSRATMSDKNYETLNEMLRNQHNHIVRTASYTTNSVVKLHEQMDNSFKSLSKREDITNKMDAIILNLEDLQSRFEDVNITLVKSNENEKLLLDSLNQFLFNYSETKTILPSIEKMSKDIKNISTKLDDIQMNSQSIDECNSKSVANFINLIDDEDEEDDENEEEELEITTPKSQAHAVSSENIKKGKDIDLQEKGPQLDNLDLMTILIRNDEKKKNITAKILNLNTETVKQLNSQELDNLYKKSEETGNTNEDSYESILEHVAVVIQNDDIRNKSMIEN